MLTLLVGLSLGQLLGTGRDGALTVGNLDTVVNAHSPVVAFTSGTSAAQVLDAADFPVGTLVLLHQAQVPVASPRSLPQFEVVSSNLGLFELARVVSVAGATLTFDHVLAQPFSTPGLQAVRVPEYTSVSVGPAASLVAPPWNGQSGGVLAVLVQGSLANQGVVSASQRGFRGGLARLSQLRAVGCSDEAEDPRTGEGLSTTPAPTGSRNLVNGGGGGSCSDNGGGGGGSVGRGGQGARYAAPSPQGTPGQGGAALLAAVEGRLLFGGGGGGGRGDIQTPTDGAAGGGVIFLRARVITGTGAFLSEGGSAAQALDDGAGGGGAGGTIDVGSAGLLECSAADARGGAGGSTTLEHGPGGGGGGGRIRLRGSPVNCVPSVLAGLAGVLLPPDAGVVSEATPSQANATGFTGDSQVRAPLVDDSDAGVLPFTDAGAVSPTVFSVTQPAPDETLFTVTPCPYGAAPLGARVSASIDGKDLGTAAPLETGQWTLCTAAGVSLRNGDHTLVATAVDGAGASLGRVEVRFKVRGPDLAVGCGCGAGQGLGFTALLVLGALAVVRRRRAS